MEKRRYIPWGCSNSTYLFAVAYRVVRAYRKSLPDGGRETNINATNESELETSQ